MRLIMIIVCVSLSAALGFSLELDAATWTLGAFTGMLAMAAALWPE